MLISWSVSRLSCVPRSATRSGEPVPSITRLVFENAPTVRPVTPSSVKRVSALWSPRVTSTAPLTVSVVSDVWSLKSSSVMLGLCVTSISKVVRPGAYVTSVAPMSVSFSKLVYGLTSTAVSLSSVTSIVSSVIAAALNSRVTVPFVSTPSR